MSYWIIPYKQRNRSILSVFVLVYLTHYYSCCYSNKIFIQGNSEASSHAWYTYMSIVHTSGETRGYVFFFLIKVSHRRKEKCITNEYWWFTDITLWHRHRIVYSTINNGKRFFNTIKFYLSNYVWYYEESSCVDWRCKCSCFFYIKYQFSFFYLRDIRMKNRH